MEGVPIVLRELSGTAWDVLCLQETHTKDNSKEARDRYIWFHGGPSEPVKREFAGVSIVVRNTWKAYISDIQQGTQRTLL